MEVAQPSAATTPKAAIHYLGPEGLYLASALSGTTDVDAVTVSTAKLANGGLDADVATIAIATLLAPETRWVTGQRIEVTGGYLL